MGSREEGEDKIDLTSDSLVGGGDRKNKAKPVMSCTLWWCWGGEVVTEESFKKKKKKITADKVSSKEKKKGPLAFLPPSARSGSSV